MASEISFYIKYIRYILFLSKLDIIFFYDLICYLITLSLMLLYASYLKLVKIIRVTQRLIADK